MQEEAQDKPLFSETAQVYLPPYSSEERLILIGAFLKAVGLTSTSRMMEKELRSGGKLLPRGIDLGNGGSTSSAKEDMIPMHRDAFHQHMAMMLTCVKSTAPELCPKESTIRSRDLGPPEPLLALEAPPPGSPPPATVPPGVPERKEEQRHTGGESEGGLKTRWETGGKETLKPEAADVIREEQRECEQAEGPKGKSRGSRNELDQSQKGKPKNVRASSEGPLEKPRDCKKGLEGNPTDSKEVQEGKSRDSHREAQLADRYAEPVMSGLFEDDLLDERDLEDEAGSRCLLLGPVDPPERVAEGAQKPQGASDPSTPDDVSRRELGPEPPGECEEALKKGAPHQKTRWDQVQEDSRRQTQSPVCEREPRAKPRSQPRSTRSPPRESRCPSNQPRSPPRGSRSPKRWRPRSGGQSRSPRKGRSRSPYRGRSRSPYRGRSPGSPYKGRSRSPYRGRGTPPRHFDETSREPRMSRSASRPPYDDLGGCVGEPRRGGGSLDRCGHRWQARGCSRPPLHEGRGCQRSRGLRDERDLRWPLREGTPDDGSRKRGGTLREGTPDDVSRKKGGKGRGYLERQIDAFLHEVGESERMTQQRQCREDRSPDVNLRMERPSPQLDTPPPALCPPLPPGPPPGHEGPLLPWMVPLDAQPEQQQLPRVTIVTSETLPGRLPSEERLAKAGGPGRVADEGYGSQQENARQAEHSRGNTWQGVECLRTETSPWGGRNVQQGGDEMGAPRAAPSATRVRGPGRNTWREQKKLREAVGMRISTEVWKVKTDDRWRRDTFAADLEKGYLPKQRWTSPLGKGPAGLDPPWLGSLVTSPVSGVENAALVRRSDDAGRWDSSPIANRGCETAGIVHAGPLSKGRPAKPSRSVVGDCDGREVADIAPAEISRNEGSSVTQDNRSWGAGSESADSGGAVRARTCVQAGARSMTSPAGEVSSAQGGAAAQVNVADSDRDRGATPVPEKPADVALGCHPGLGIPLQEAAGGVDRPGLGPPNDDVAVGKPDDVADELDPHCEFFITDWAVSPPQGSSPWSIPPPSKQLSAEIPFPITTGGAEDLYQGAFVRGSPGRRHPTETRSLWVTIPATGHECLAEGAPTKDGWDVSPSQANFFDSLPELSEAWGLAFKTLPAPSTPTSKTPASFIQVASLPSNPLPSESPAKRSRYDDAGVADVCMIPPEKTDELRPLCPLKRKAVSPLEGEPPLKRARLGRHPWEVVDKARSPRQPLEGLSPLQACNCDLGPARRPSLVRGQEAGEVSDEEVLLIEVRNGCSRNRGAAAAQRGSVPRRRTRKTLRALYQEQKGGQEKKGKGGVTTRGVGKGPNPIVVTYSRRKRKSPTADATADVAAEAATATESAPADVAGVEAPADVADCGSMGLATVPADIQVEATPAQVAVGAISADVAVARPPDDVAMHLAPGDGTTADVAADAAPADVSALADVAVEAALAERHASVDVAVQMAPDSVAPPPAPPADVASEGAPTELATDSAPADVATKAAPAYMAAGAAPGNVAHADVAPEAAPGDVAPEAAPADVAPEAAPADVAPEAAPDDVAHEEAPADVALEAAPGDVAHEEAPADVAPEEAPSDVAAEAAPVDVAHEEAPGDVALEAAVPPDSSLGAAPADSAATQGPPTEEALIGVKAPSADVAREEAAAPEQRPPVVTSKVEVIDLVNEDDNVIDLVESDSDDEPILQQELVLVLHRRPPLKRKGAVGSSLM